jgi:PQQ-like domain
VYALDANTGAELWSYTTGGAVYSSPAVANGMVYIGSDDGKLYCFGLTDEDRESASAQPDLKSLSPDFRLRASKPLLTSSHQ